MKQVVHKLVHLVLALLVVGSTTSWTVDKHLCMGRVMDVALFHKAASCGMDQEGASDAHYPCCDDESFTVQGQDELNGGWDHDSVKTPVFLLAHLHSHGEPHHFPRKAKVFGRDYPPPLLVHDLQLLYDVFLI